MSSDAFFARRYAPGDEGAIVAMLAETFDSRWSVERWHWCFEGSPAGPSCIQVLEQDGRVVGHRSQIAFELFVDGRRLLGHRSSFLVVAAELRGRGGMRRMVEVARGADPAASVLISCPYERSSALAQRYGVAEQIGRVPRWARWLSAPPDLGSRRRRIRAGALRLYSSVASWRSSHLAVERLDELGAEVDELAAASVGFARCIGIRDSAYLRWRWLGQPGGPSIFRFLGVRAQDGELRGLVVFAAKGTDGRVVDVLARDEPALRALLCGAADALASLGCSRAILDYLDPRPWARRAVLRSGFLPVREGMILLTAALSPAAGPAPTQYPSWYVTTGDTDRL
jgi:hypothetical protein